MNSGTTASWVGTAIVAMTNGQQRGLPRNRSLAKAKPASVPKNDDRGGGHRETRRLLPSAFQNGDGLDAALGVVEEVAAGQERRDPLGGHSSVCEPIRNDQ